MQGEVSDMSMHQLPLENQLQNQTAILDIDNEEL